MADVVMTRNSDTAKKAKKPSDSQVVSTEKKEVIVGKKTKRYEIKTLRDGRKKCYLVEVVKKNVAKKQRQVV